MVRLMAISHSCFGKLTKVILSHTRRAPAASRTPDAAPCLVVWTAAGLDTLTVDTTTPTVDSGCVSGISLSILGRLRTMCVPSQPGRPHSSQMPSELRRLVAVGRFIGPKLTPGLPHGVLTRYQSSPVA